MEVEIGNLIVIVSLLHGSSLTDRQDSKFVMYSLAIKI